VVELFAAVPAGVLLDATVGGGGHAAAILSSRPDVVIVGVDRDPAAVVTAKERLAAYGQRAVVVHGELGKLGEALARAGAETLGVRSLTPLSGVLFDLGLSSAQIDDPERGFSYIAEGPLDMRMDPDAPLSAAHVVNEYSEERLVALFAMHGEAKNARRIASAIVKARPLSTTSELARLVAETIGAGARDRRGNPAKRVFQAVRAEVNDELRQLEKALKDAIELLLPGGRLVCIAYHSGEDRLVKAAMREAVTGGCTCPPGLPCGCGAVPLGRLVFNGSRKPSKAEIRINPRSSSARLRCFERLDAEPGSRTEGP
jgi:16S rRNA (cytosine1402-N4)-methyltransferase